MSISTISKFRFCFLTANFLFERETMKTVAKLKSIDNTSNATSMRFDFFIFFAFFAAFCEKFKLLMTKNSRTLVSFAIAVFASIDIMKLFFCLSLILVSKMICVCYFINIFLFSKRNLRDLFLIFFNFFHSRFISFETNWFVFRSRWFDHILRFTILFNFFRNVQIFSVDYAFFFSIFVLIIVIVTGTKKKTQLKTTTLKNVIWSFFDEIITRRFENISVLTTKKQ